MISKGEVIRSEERMDDLVEVMLGHRFPIDFDLGNSPYPDLIDIISDDEDTAFPDWTEPDYPDDWECENYEPDIDEAQEWYDYDPDC